MSNEIQRRFSLEEDFMNYGTNDLLYGFMRCLSTAEPIRDDKGNIIKYQEYLTKKNFLKNKKTIAAICGCSTRTINNHINKLFEAGLLDEGFVMAKSANGKEIEYECFWFPCDKSQSYKLVNRDFIKYLVDTRNAHTIRIYLYLLNKYQWKQELKEKYIFTKKEIKIALGYAETSKSMEESIGNVLKSLAREEIIKYRKVWVTAETDNGFNGTERMELDFVATKESELRKVLD